MVEIFEVSRLLNIVGLGLTVAEFGVPTTILGYQGPVLHFQHISTFLEAPQKNSRVKNVTTKSQINRQTTPRR